MPDISLVIDGENQTVPAGTTGTTWFEKSRDVVAIKVDGTPRDLAIPFEEARPSRPSPWPARMA